MARLLKGRNFKSPFVRRVGTLVGGTAVAQFIAVLALPILTRLYAPEDFSALAVYSSVLALLTVIACLRFEIAIPLPRSERIAAALCVLALISVLTVTTITLSLVVMFPELLDRLVGFKVSQYLWLIPVGVFAVGTYNALQYWATRKKEFGLISKTRVAQSVSGTGIKLGSGFFLNGWTSGLIFGQLTTLGAGFVALGIAVLRNDWNVFKSLKPIHLKAAFKRYEKFPKYSTLEAFANAGSIQIPIILIAYISLDAEAGYIIVAMQLLSAPMGLIGAAVAQVYLAEGAERFHRGELKEFTHRTVLSLAKISAGPLLMAALASPILMPFFLGEHWGRSGTLVTWMAPWFFIQFIASPVSMSLHITHNQKKAFILQVAGLIIRVGSVFFAYFFISGYEGEIYALSGAVFYGIYLFVVLQVLATSETHLEK